MEEKKERVTMAKVTPGKLIKPFREGDKQMNVKDIRDEAIKKIWGDKVKKKPANNQNKKPSEKKEK